MSNSNGVDEGPDRSDWTEWRWWAASVFMTGVLVIAVHVVLGMRDGIPAGLAAVCLCATVSAAPMIWRRMAFGVKMPLASTLLTITVRMLLMVAALGFAAATKWSHRNSFAVSLLGCYFIFLTLESALSIRYYSSRSSR